MLQEQKVPLHEVMRAPIFIVGTQRSGTTLLCRMLTAHPHIFIKNEISHTCDVFSKQTSRHAIIEGLDAEMRRIYGSGLEEFLSRTDKMYWGIKDPRLTYCLDCVEKHFGDARILIIIRDGRAVANSYIKSGWGIATNVYYGAKRWETEVHLQMAFAKRNPEKCLIVKYEDLVRSPEDELRNICVFLKEPYRESMCKYYEQTSYIKERKSSENTFRKPNEAIAYKWKDELTPFQISVFESVAGATLQQHGYALEGNRITVPSILRWYFYGHQKILGELQMQRQLRMQGLVKMVAKQWSKVRLAANRK